MLSKIIEAERDFNALLPLRRLEQSPPAELLAAGKAWSDAVWDQAEQKGAMPLTAELLTKGRNLASNPVFICGVHRSGTTLVRDLLDGHPQLVVLPSEGTYYTNLEFKLQLLPENERIAFLGKEWLRRLANPINQPPYWLLGHSKGAHSQYVDFARYFMAWWEVLKREENTQWPHMAIVLAYALCAGNLTAKLWVDKTPANERFLERIWHAMPEAKIIHVIRDPVNTLASRKKMEPGVNIRSALHDMKISFNVAVKHSADPRFILLRYEELCNDPQMIIQQLASFLNIESSPALNQATVAGMPAQANSSFNNDTVPGQIIKPAQHQQPEVLSMLEHQLLAAYIGSVAGKLNYPVTRLSVLHKYYLKFKYRLL